MNQPKKRERVIVFDVNETLLDIETLNPLFARVFGDARVMRQWFAELILYSEALTLSGSYTPFGQLAVAVFNMLAEIRGVDLEASSIEELKERMARMPAHPDAAPALAPFLAGQFSVDVVKRFKPSVEVYRSVESALGVEASALRMVAAHAWDTLGATAAGWKAALVTRPGNAALPVGDQPDIIERDLLAVAERIISSDF